MNYEIFIDGCWVKGAPAHGARFRELDDSGFVIRESYWCEQSVIDAIELERLETEFVSSELLRTDRLVLLPDYPHMEKVIEYRKLLRSYDLSGNRPQTPTTDRGTLI